MMHKTPLRPSRTPKPRRRPAVEVLCRLGLALDSLTGTARFDRTVHWWADTPNGRERLCDGLGVADGVSFGFPDEVRNTELPQCEGCIAISIDSLFAYAARKGTIVIGVDLQFYTGGDEVEEVHSLDSPPTPPQRPLAGP